MPAWAVANCSNSPIAKGIPKIIIFNRRGRVVEGPLNWLFKLGVSLIKFSVQDEDDQAACPKPQVDIDLKFRFSIRSL